MNNNKGSRGNSPRRSNKGNTRKSSRSRSTHTRRATNVTSTNNNTVEDDKYRFSRTLKGTIRQDNNNAKSRSRSRTKKKFHMPHIIPNISPAALLKKHRTGVEGRHHENHMYGDNYSEHGGYTRRKQRRGRSSTPKGYHRVVGEQQEDYYTSNTSRKRDGGNTNNRGKRSFSSNAAYSRNTSSAAFGLRSRRSRSASFQPNQRQQQQYYDDDLYSNYNGMRTRSSSGRRKGNVGGTKPWQRTTDQANHNNNGDEKRNRRRGKSVPARFFNTMSKFGLWKGDKDRKKNDSYNSNNNRNRRSEDRKERKIRMKSDLEAPLPDNVDKRMSSRSRERGKRSSAHPAPNEWGEKPRGRSRPHTRSRSDNYNNNNNNATFAANAEQIKDLEAEIANVIKTAGPPPPPRPPPPPIHARPTNNNFYDTNRSGGNNNNNNKNNPRSKSLPKNFQRYTLQDVMVEMEKEIEVPLRKKYSNDSVISPIASMDSSWRYQEQMLLRKTMASLNEQQKQQQQGRGGEASVTPKFHFVPKKRNKSVTRFQPPPPPVAPPPLAPPPRAAKVIDMNAIDGDDDDEEEELELKVKESVNVSTVKNETEERIVLSPRRSKSVPARVVEKEASVTTSLNEVSFNDESNNSTSVDIEGKSSSESKQERTALSDSFVSNDFTFGSRLRPEPIVSVYGSSETGSPDAPTNEASTITPKNREPPGQDSSESSSSSSSSSASGSSTAIDGDSLIGYASVASSIAPPPHSSIRKKKPGAIALGTTPMSADRSAAHSMGTLTRMHNDLQRKMSAMQEGLDEHGRPVKEFDVKSVDTSSGRVSDVTLPTVLMKAPPISSRIRAMKPKPLTTRRTKKGTLELQGDIEAMKSLAVSELTMASPVQSAYPKNMNMRIYSYKKVANNTLSSSALPPPRRASAPVQPSRRHIQPKQETTPVVEKVEEQQQVDSSKKNSSTRSFQSKSSSGSKVSIGTTSRMPMKPASGAGHRHVPPPPKQRSFSEIDIGEVAQQLQAVQNHGASTGSTGSNNGNRNSSRKYVSKGSGNSYNNVTHSHVDRMKWSDKFGKAGRYSGDVNADYVPHGMGSMYYDFGLTVEGRWVDGTLLSHDLNDGFAV